MTEADSNGVQGCLYLIRLDPIEESHIRPELRGKVLVGFAIDPDDLDALCPLHVMTPGGYLISRVPDPKPEPF